jgi:hypothetical protein
MKERDSMFARATALIVELKTPLAQTCQQSIQINLINQAVTICTASQANPAYRKIAVNQAQNCRIN